MGFDLEASILLYRNFNKEVGPAISGWERSKHQPKRAGTTTKFYVELFPKTIRAAMPKNLKQLNC